MNIWALVDGTARFPAAPVRVYDGPRHAIRVGWYTGDVPICGRCSCAIEPTSVTRDGIARGWRHRT